MLAVFGSSNNTGRLFLVMAELLLLALTVLIWPFLCHLQPITSLSFSAKTPQENHESLLPHLFQGILVWWWLQFLQQGTWHPASNSFTPDAKLCIVHMIWVIAVPAMAIEHMLLFGTCWRYYYSIIVNYFLKTEPTLDIWLSETEIKINKLQKKILVILLLLCLITPVGINAACIF